MRAGRLAIQIAVVASLGVTLFAAIANPGWLTVPALLAGWFAADMASGIIHMYMDYRPCRAGVGFDRLYFYQGSRESDEYQAMFRQTMAKVNPFERLVYDFKNHHPRPDALGRRDLWRQIGSTVVAVILPVSILVNALWLALDLPGWMMAGLFSLLIGGMFAQYFHGTLHRADNPWIVRAMRRVGLLMTPAAHQLHHDTLQRDFSTNCGWSNPFLNLFFRRARAIGHFTDAGLEPTA